LPDSSLPSRPDAPVGIFDSGIGGLSVLRHVHALLPHEELIYFADSGFAPYGDKPEDVIVERALAIAAFLLQFKIKAMVVACNTATAAAIAGLRARYPQLQVVGVEPGLKPAAAQTQSKVVGVLATARTLASRKFLALQEQVEAATGVHFLPQACTGLADQIEKGEINSRETASLVQRYVAPLLDQGADTLVLGCTHYPFVLPLIELAAAGKKVHYIDTGAAVARQLQRLLQQHDLLCKPPPHWRPVSSYTTGSRSALANAFHTLLALNPTVEQLASERFATEP
jgi:glutamate racemase